MVETRRLSELAASVTPRLELPEGHLVVALSGGADSSALAWLCSQLGRSTRALHVNHGFQHSDLMESAARSVAEQLGLDLEIIGVEIQPGPSLEGRARDARYEVFERVQGEALLTAHTLDDDAETVLLNLTRGAGPRGLSGIPYHRPPAIYRPMLEVRRSETREIAGLAGIEFVDDPMNDDPTFTRNWIRRVVVPQLESVNPRVSESLHRASRLLRLELGYLEDRAGAVRLTLGDAMAKAAKSVLLTIDSAVAGRVMMLMLEHVMGPTALTEARMAKLWSVLRGESARQELGDGGFVELDGVMLVIRVEDQTRSTEAVTLTPGLHRVGRLEYEVHSPVEPCRVLPLSKWAAVFPAGTDLVARADGVVTAGGREAWIPGEKRLPVAWYDPGEVGYLSVRAREGTGWRSSR